MSSDETADDQPILCHTCKANGRDRVIIPSSTALTGYVHQATRANECHGLLPGRSGRATPARDMSERTVLGPYVANSGPGIVNGRRFSASGP